MRLPHCSSGTRPADQARLIRAKAAGEITVLTNRTDIVDTAFNDNAAEFETAYAGTTVKFEAIAKYGTDVASESVVITVTSTAALDLAALSTPTGLRSGNQLVQR